jgi:HK97 family phage major capsid protein
MNYASAALIDHHTREIQKQLLVGDPRPGDRFSISKLVRGMAGENVTGYERSVLEATAGLAGQKSLDQQRVTVPWGVLFQRDLAFGTGSSGGYLVGTEVTNPTDILRGFSVVADAGITILPGLTASVAVPRVTTAPTTMVLADEQTAITESTAAPVFGVSNLSPKNLGCYVEMSRSLLLQSQIAERYARTVLLGALGQFFDKQILQGVGSNGELLGLFNVSGLGTQAGTSISQSGVTSMAQKSSEAGVRDAELAFISTPAVRQLLQIREKASGNGGFVWQNDTVADRRAFASNECGSAAMVCGPWPRAIVGMWGPGPQIEVNPYAQFQAGIVGVRVLLSADWSPVFPGAFVKSTSIT